MHDVDRFKRRASHSHHVPESKRFASLVPFAREFVQTSRRLSAVHGFENLLHRYRLTHRLVLVTAVVLEC